MKLENQVVSPSGRKLRGGGYQAIHKWLKKNFGKPNKCQNPLCDKTRDKFHYALLKNKKHEHKRENYIMLCTKCHFNYDVTIERRKRQAKALKGKKHSKKHNENISKSCKGIHKNNKHSAKQVVAMKDNQEFIFKSITDASIVLGTSMSNISTCLSGITKTAGGYKWKSLVR